MLLQGEEGDKKMKGEEQGAFTPLHCAVVGGSEQCLALLLAHDDGGVNSPDLHLRTPLHLAATNGMVASGQLLLEQGASLEVEDKAGRTPLLGAAQGGHTNMLELLQEQGATVEVQDSKGNTALHLTCAGGHNAAASLLLRLPASTTSYCNRQDCEGRTALHLAAANGMVEGVESLLGAGASVTIVDNCGNPPALACAKDEDTATCLAMILALYLSTPTSETRKSLRSMSSLGSLRKSE